MSKIDIVALIETNPLTKLSSSYNNKLLKKIKDNFTENQQQLFITSFYCWLNYHPLNDFIIDLDNIWWRNFLFNKNLTPYSNLYYLVYNKKKEISLIKENIDNIELNIPKDIIQYILYPFI